MDGWRREVAREDGSLLPVAVLTGRQMRGLAGGQAGSIEEVSE